MAERWAGKVELLGSFDPALFKLSAAAGSSAVHLGQIGHRDFVVAEYGQWQVDSAADGVPRPTFNWRTVQDLRPDAVMLALFDDKRTFAFLQMETARRMPVGGIQGTPIVYVSFLEAAPIVRRSVGRQLGQAFGSFLLGVACDTSFGADLDGRVGLHATAGAEPYYKSRGFQELDCPNEYHEVYLQIGTASAMRLVETFRSAR